MSGVLGSYTTFGIGGDARRVETVASRGELIALAPCGIVLGGGSNVLIADGYYDGTVVINRYADIDVDGCNVTVGSGMRLPALCAALARQGLSGLEWAVGIPGSVGGAVRMNAGAFSHSISEFLLCATVLSAGGVRVLAAEDMELSYRHSGLAAGDVVIDATFALKPDDKRAIAERCRYYAAARRARQPSGRSAGSVFKNPPGLAIGKIIEQAGYKGFRVGGAMVSREHANVIINTGGATAKDVKTIIDAVKRALYAMGVTAEEEIIYIGDF